MFVVKMNAMVGGLNAAREEFGMRIERKKSKYMVISAKPVRANVKVGQKEIEQMNGFKCLGSIIEIDMR